METSKKNETSGQGLPSETPVNSTLTEDQYKYWEQSWNVGQIPPFPTSELPGYKEGRQSIIDEIKDKILSIDERESDSAVVELLHILQNLSA